MQPYSKKWLRHFFDSLRGEWETLAAFLLFYYGIIIFEINHLCSKCNFFSNILTDINSIIKVNYLLHRLPRKFNIPCACVTIIFAFNCSGKFIAVCYKICLLHNKILTFPFRTTHYLCLRLKIVICYTYNCNCLLQLKIRDIFFW